MKKAVSVLILTALTLAFAGCGKEDVRLQYGEAVFECDDVDADITGFCLCIGANYYVDFNEGTIKVDRPGGDCIETYLQEYDSGRDRWSEIEYSVEVFPETSIEPDEAAVQPTEASEPAPPVSSDAILVPFLAVYDEDEWMPEGNEYLYGFVDLDGNVVYEPQFDHVQFCDKLTTYILSRTEDGVTKYGLMLGDGSLSTDLIYDGAFYDQGDIGTDVGCIYLTIYDEGILHTTIYGLGFFPVDGQDITLDEDVLPFDAATYNPAVCHMTPDSAVIENLDEFYPTRVLVDITSGEVLYDFTDRFSGELLFGDLIIIDGPFNGVTVYDMTGECVLEDEGAYGTRVTVDKYLIYHDGQVDVIDKSGEAVATLAIGNNATVETACGLIAVCEGGDTTVYDAELNVLAELGAIDISSGYCPGNWSDGIDTDNLFFVSYDDDTITNLLNGASIPVENGYFYSYEGGYIMADNRSDGNNPVNHWHLYDSALNVIFEGDGYGQVIEDAITGELYLVSCGDSVTSVYSLDTCEKLFDLDGNYGYYTARAYAGEFYLTNLDQCILVDASDDEIFSWDIERLSH
ncbi:MAG: hypothetical protein IJ757_09230 [Clostridiales bacterium]|nr:hypothetical protein [Clostridiales bacterium]